MYKNSTYFYWCLIICLKLGITIEYCILRLFRWPILRLVKKKFLKEFQINVLFEDEKNLENKLKPALTLRFKDRNLVLKLITEGRLPFFEGILHHQIEAEPITEILERIATGNEISRNPLLILQEWVYLNASEFPWDVTTSNDGDWALRDTKDIICKMMDGELICSSGYWDQEDLNVHTATERNWKIIGDKLNLKPGMRVLDIGCGTGVFANYLANNYMVNVIGINFCKEEVDRVDKSNPNIQIIHGDYRVLLENKKYHNYFDRVVAIHLLEHLGGPKSHSDYFNSINQYLKPNVGKVFIQTNVLTRKVSLRVDFFMKKYFLPRYVCPFTKEIMDGLSRANFTISNIESTGDHYSKTVQEYGKLRKNISGDSLAKEVLEIYHNLGMAGFKTRLLDLWQIVATKR